MNVYSQAYQQDLQDQEGQFLQAYPKIKHIKKWKKACFLMIWNRI